MSTLKPEERHQMVLDFVNSKKRLNVKVFHLRWSEPALLTEKVLLQTPPFWYKKYGWRRRHVETMFFEAEIELSYLLISAFDEVYGGGYKGKRWRNGALRGKLDDIWERLYGKKPQTRHDKKSKKKKQGDEQISFDDFMKALKAHNVTISDQLARYIFDQMDANKNGFITKQEMDQYLEKLDGMDLDNVPNLLDDPEMLNLVMAKNVLQCVLSEEGLKFVETEFIANLKANQQLDIDPQTVAFDNKLTFEQFLQTLDEKNVVISKELARNLFDQMDINKEGYITKESMEEYLAKINNMNLSMDDAAQLANDPELLNFVMSKHILECVLSEEGLEFVETEFIADLTAVQDFSDIDPECIAYLNKLGDRDIDWEERVIAMNTVNAGIVSGKYDKILMDDDQLRQLLFGLAAQILDENAKVQSTAIEVVPNVLDECFNKAANINVVYEHLPEIIDNLFKVLDNPKCKANHQSVKFGIDELIDMIVNTQHPVAGLQLAKIFADKCEIENMNTANARNFGLQCLSKIMFSLDSPYLSFDTKQLKAPKVDESKLPSNGDPYREWLDTATEHQPGPSKQYMQRTQQTEDKNVKKYISGEINELTLGYGKFGSDTEDEKQMDNNDTKKTLMDKTSDEIGTEFVDAVSGGLSAAMMDPNRNNKIHAFKTNNILNQLHPEFSQNLDKESKRRYDQWESGDMKPWANSKPKALPPRKKIDPTLVSMSTKTKIGVASMKPSLPDI
eukprot:250260_1